MGRAVPNDFREIADCEGSRASKCPTGAYEAPRARSSLGLAKRSDRCHLPTADAVEGLRQRLRLYLTDKPAKKDLGEPSSFLVLFLFFSIPQASQKFSASVEKRTGVRASPLADRLLALAFLRRPTSVSELQSRLGKQPIVWKQLRPLREEPWFRQFDYLPSAKKNTCFEPGFPSSLFFAIAFSTELSAKIVLLHLWNCRGAAAVLLGDPGHRPHSDPNTRENLLRPWKQLFCRNTHIRTYQIVGRYSSWTKPTKYLNTSKL